jgi:hypothetical protein
MKSFDAWLEEMTEHIRKKEAEATAKVRNKLFNAEEEEEEAPRLRKKRGRTPP